MVRSRIVHSRRKPLPHPSAHKTRAGGPGSGRKNTAPAQRPQNAARAVDYDALAAEYQGTATPATRYPFRARQIDRRSTYRGGLHLPRFCVKQLKVVLDWLIASPMYQALSPDVQKIVIEPG